MTRSVYVGAGGDVTLRLADDAGSVTLKVVPAGTNLAQPTLPPGPAFIQLPRRLPWPYESRAEWAAEYVPEGYRYQPATEWTGAGWVRPYGSN